MKRFLLSFLLIFSLVCLPGVPVLAYTVGQLGGQDSSGDYHWEISHEGTMTGNSNAELSLGDIALTNWGTSIRFHPKDFTAFGYDVNGEGYLAFTLITNATIPAMNLQNQLTALVWADGEESYAQVTFKVPADYVSGGGFRAMVDYNTGSDNPEIQYFVYVNTDGTAWDTTYTRQTPVDPGGTAGTPVLVNLPIATDFASLAAGDVVTFAIDRSDEESSAANLEVYYVEFYYNE